MTQTVLLVEDDPDVRETIAEILDDEGYTVVTACDGGEGLTQLRDGLRPAVIVLDLMMAGMDGFEFRAAQRAEPQLAGIPVVVLTADRQVEEKIEELAVDAYLRKPTRLAELLAVIARVARGEIPGR
jgi:CheY-like chemotaxis protein